MSGPSSMGLTARFALFTAILATASALAVAALLVELDRRHTVRDLELRATAIARGIAARAGELLDRADVAGLTGLADEGWREPDIARIEIGGPGGRVLASYRAEALRVAGVPPVVVPVTGPVDDEGFRDALGQVKVHLSAQAIDDRRQEYTARAVPVALGVAGGGVIIALLLSAAITAPLRRLRSAIVEAATGHYAAGAEVPVEGPREVQVLGAAFREAAAAIAGREAELKSTNDALRQTEAQRDAMTHMLVHDLKGPLSNVLMLLSLIESTLGDPEDRALLVQTRTRCEGLVSMISDLLMVARLEGADVSVDRQTHVIDDLVDGALASIQVLASQRGARIHAETPEDDDATIECDGRLMERVLLNLLTNALRYGASPIHVRASIADDAVRFEVEDAGPGIPPDKVERYFEKFGTGASGGTGLGLAFVGIVIAAHGGTIEVVGPRFTIALPRSVAEDATA